MDEKETTLSMDETDKPDLVDAPTIDHGMKAEPEPQETEAEAKPERERGPDGKFVSKDQGDKPAEEAASAPPAPEESNVPVKALQEERRKRRELEQQLEAMQRQFAAQQQPPADSTPDGFWDNPQGAIAQQVQQMLTVRELTKSINRAKTRHNDFDTAFEEFNRLEALNPALTQQALASDDPAEFAYQTVKRAAEVAQYGSIDALLEAKRAEWEAELRAKAPQPRQTFPTSTVSDGSVASRGGPVWAGPTQDRDILPMG